MIKALDYNTIQELVRGENEGIKELRKKAYEEFSKVPMPVWKRVKLDDIHLPYYKEYKISNIKNSDQEGLVIEKTNVSVSDDDIFTLGNILKHKFGVDEKFKNLALAFYNTGYILRAMPNANLKKPVMINFGMDNDNNTLIDNNIIIAERNSSITIVFDYNSDVMGFHNGLTAIIAKDGSNINIVKVQRLHDESGNFDNNIIITGNDANITWTQVELGSKVSAHDVTAEMEGSGSSFYLNSIFLGVDSANYDMSYRVNHYAPRTECNVDVKGALKDKAKAVFRGNLDMKRGSRKSKGNESEIVLLLDKDVRSDAIPALWCTEDDVKANHAASAGRIDENKLFYMMSRGLSEDEAKSLMVEANFNPVIDSLPDDDLKKSIREYVERRIAG